MAATTLSIFFTTGAQPRAGAPLAATRGTIARITIENTISVFIIEPRAEEDSILIQTFLPVSSSGALPYTSTCPLTRSRPRKDLITSPCRCRSCALFTVEEGHEPEIHVWLHVAVEEAQARLVSGEVDSHLLEFAEHRNVLHHTRSW